jgi:MoxR-like ATPase
MVWQPYYRGDGVSRGTRLPTPPPWRSFPARPPSDRFQPPAGLVEAVNAALHLRRPLLLTGAPGSGKSTVIDSVAAELALGAPLKWHITSRSSLGDALYRYDVLGRVNAQQLRQPGEAALNDDISDFMQFGPLGTALLPQDRPRALLVDEFDKGDFDLPGDLLNILEAGEFEIPELARHKQKQVSVREWDGSTRHAIEDGLIRCRAFPVIIVTSNGERDFAAPFLRRCVRYTMPVPDREFLGRVISAHLGEVVANDPIAEASINTYLGKLAGGQEVAVDQLLNAIFLLTGESPPDDQERAELQDLLLRELSGA